MVMCCSTDNPSDHIVRIETRARARTHQNLRSAPAHRSYRNPAQSRARAVALCLFSSEFDFVQYSAPNQSTQYKHMLDHRCNSPLYLCTDCVQNVALCWLVGPVSQVREKAQHRIFLRPQCHHVVVKSQPQWRLWQ